MSYKNDIGKAFKFLAKHPDCDFYGIDPGQNVGISKVVVGKVGDDENELKITQTYGESITNVSSAIRHLNQRRYAVLFIEWGTWKRGAHSAAMSAYANPIIAELKKIYGRGTTAVIKVPPNTWQAARLAGMPYDPASKIKKTKQQSINRCIADGLIPPESDHIADAYNILQFGRAELGVK